ncbi:retropepsin-like aspartic protease family protein [Oleiphilus messinensis]|nr:retropepsin-like aspartic protease [Oleiphilus messinensis]
MVARLASTAFLSIISVLPGLVPVTAAEALRIEIQALFKGKAMISVNGQPGQLMRVGDTGPNGIKLLSATSRIATVEVAGESMEIGLSQTVSTRFAQPQTRYANIARVNAHYPAMGSINGLPVRFLVDTGATIIAMNRQHAKRLGIQFRLEGTPGKVATASGVATYYSVTLDRVKVGEIELTGVEAGVLDGDSPDMILLGMSFLKRLEMVEKDGVLQLIQRF